MKPNYGEWAFLAGVALAVIVGLFSSFLGSSLPMVMAVLAVLGLVVGFLNVQEKEMNSFLIATIALLLVATSWQPIVDLLAVLTGSGGVGATLGTWITSFMSAVVAFVSPAAFIVALKAVYNLTQ